MIEEYFRNLDISDNEAKVYLVLAEVGKTTASLIAKKIQFPRSTVYTILDSLKIKGLISVEQTQEVTFYVANKPSSLKRMVEEEKKSAKERFLIKEDSASKLTEQLEVYFKQQNYSIPKLQFFEGTNGVKNMLYDYSKIWQESITKYDTTWWGYQDIHFVETYREWLDLYWSNMLKDERVLLLSNHSPVEKKLKKKIRGRQIKMVPKKYDFSSTIWVLGDYVVTVMTRQKPHYAFMLNDAVFAAGQRITYQMLWELI